MSVMPIAGKQHDDGWRVIKRALGPSDREALSFAQNAEGHVKFRLEKWQRYYEPSSDDLNAPVEGGLWIGEYSGRYHRFQRQSETPLHPSYGLKPPIIYEFTT